MNLLSPCSLQDSPPSCYPTLSLFATLSMLDVLRDYIHKCCAAILFIIIFFLVPCPVRERARDLERATSTVLNYNIKTKCKHCRRSFYMTVAKARRECLAAERERAQRRASKPCSTDTHTSNEQAKRGALKKHDAPIISTGYFPRGSISPFNAMSCFRSSELFTGG